MTNYDKDLARHEAAHFVVHWAVESPAYQVDITPEGQREGALGITKGCPDAPSPFTDIIVSLAGPVADYWELDNDRLIDCVENQIKLILETYTPDNPHHPSDGLDGAVQPDLQSAINGLLLHEIDILNPRHFKDALCFYLDGVRSILTLCKAEWKEATDYLVANGRIGFDGDHPDQGEGAEVFFCRWGGDWGEPPEEVRQTVEKFRNATSTAQALPPPQSV